MFKELREDTRVVTCKITEQSSEHNLDSSIPKLWKCISLLLVVSQCFGHFFLLFSLLCFLLSKIYFIFFL